MTNTTNADNGSDMSGFAVALGFIIYAAIWLAAPGNYFTGVERTSDGALVSYIVALISLAVGVMGMGLELSNKEVSAFIGRLLRGGVPRGVYEGPSSEAWTNLGITVGTLILSGVLYLIGIELFDLTGVIGGIVKVVVLLSLAIPVWFFAWFLDELITKPLLLSPAKRLAESPEPPPDNPSTVDAGNTSRLQASGGPMGAVRGLAGIIVPVADFLGALFLFWQIISRILETIS